MNKKLVRGLILAMAVISLMLFCAWGFTTLTVASARAKGEYASAEAGMLALIDKGYAPDHTVKIWSARPNEHNGSKPYIWYVIAEVRASSRADGSALGHNGCDAPGSFFVQLKDGKWVHIPEGLFIVFTPSLLETFGFAGEGEITPTTDVINGPMRLCQ